jgi:hypothetical protein
MLTTKERFGGSIKAKMKYSIKFDSSREVDYKKISSLMREREKKCYFCKEKGHRTSNCPKNPNKSYGEKKAF